jgi:hypothetical protein
MRFPSRLRRFLSVAAALAALAGCSDRTAQSLGGMPAVQPATASLDAFPVNNGVYISMGNPGQTNLYALPDSKNVASKCAIATGVAHGIGVDSVGTLWVTNPGSSQITSYTKGSCTQAALTLNETNGVPFDVAISSTGMVYVADIQGTGGTHGLISVYNEGDSTPSSTLTDPEIVQVRAVAVDDVGNVFGSCVKEQKSFVIEFKHGKMPGTLLRLQVGIADGLEFDAHQNLIVVDPGSRRIQIFAPPYQGAPTSSFPLKGSSEYAKLDAANKNLYASDFSSGSVDVFQYPSGTFKYSITNGLIQSHGVVGIAVDPASKN